MTTGFPWLRGVALAFVAAGMGCAQGQIEYEGGAPGDGMTASEATTPTEETVDPTEDATPPPPDEGTMMTEDAGPVDTGNMTVEDTGVIDTGVIDTGVIDSGVRDTGVIDLGVIDTGVRDTGPIDTGPVDTGVRDTGPVDTGPPPDTGLMCMEVLSSVTCTGRYNCCATVPGFGVPAGCGCQVPIVGCVARGLPGCN